jgi:hypothetical protein
MNEHDKQFINLMFAFAADDDPMLVRMGRKALAILGVNILPPHLKAALDDLFERIDRDEYFDERELTALQHSISVHERANRVGLVVVDGGRRVATLSSSRAQLRSVARWS